MTTFQLLENETPGAIIRVVGIGGGGGNAVAHMIGSEMEGVEFVYANTDAQALNGSSISRTLQIGQNVTRGLGAGANPEVGRQAALEDRERIIECLQNTDMVFITAGMGGGTGTGAAPVIAQIAKEMGVLTVAVVTKPFPFEQRRRMKVAEQGLEELAKHVDSLITIPNEKLIEVLGGDVKLVDAFASANDVLQGAVKGIAELITHPGLINVDFADVKAVMSEMGMAMMGTGSAKGEGRAVEAAESAINSPLLEDVDITGACGVLVNISAGADLSLNEFNDVGSIIGEFASEDADVVIGTSIDEDSKDEVRVTVVATGLRREALSAVKRPRVEVVRNATDGQPDYSELDTPTVIRQKSQSPVQSDLMNDSVSEEYLNIPTFLRKRQAD